MGFQESLECTIILDSSLQNISILSQYLQWVQYSIYIYPILQTIQYKPNQYPSSTICIVQSAVRQLLMYNVQCTARDMDRTISSTLTVNVQCTVYC